MSDEEVMRELEEAGMTREEVRAAAEEMVRTVPLLVEARIAREREAAESAALAAKSATMESADETAKVAPVVALPARGAEGAPARRRPRGAEMVTSWLAVVAAVGAVGGALGLRAWSLAQHPHDPNAPDAEPGLTDTELAAKRLRAEAFAACDEGRWPACAAKLDEARAIDPAGEDRDPRIAELRRKMAPLLPPQPAPEKGPRPGGGGNNDKGP